MLFLPLEEMTDTAGDMVEMTRMKQYTDGELADGGRVNIGFEGANPKVTVFAVRRGLSSSHRVVFNIYDCLSHASKIDAFLHFLVNLEIF